MGSEHPASSRVRLDHQGATESPARADKPEWFVVPVFFIGADERSRTPDLLITNQLLYQLSYISTETMYYTEFWVCNESS